MAGEDSAEEREEAPTGRRLQKARDEGEAARSVEVPAASVLIACMAFLVYDGAGMAERLRILFAAGFIFDHAAAQSTSTLPAVFAHQVGEAFLIIAPLLGVSILAAVVGSSLTGGFLFALVAAGPRPGRLNPLSGLGRMFGMQMLMGLGKTILKFMLVIGIFVWVLNDNLHMLMLLGTMDIEVALSRAGALIVHSALLITLSFVLIAAFDALYQRHAFMKRMRMSKQEVREEMKDIEGQPEVRARIRRRQREMSAARMMDRVKDADVVITNPEHFAVALSYDPTRDGAPLLLAKGQDALAFRIIEEARKCGVHKFEAAPLARALYFTTKLEEPIHEDLYVPVAQVIAYVFSLNSFEPGRAAVLRPEVEVPESVRFNSDGTRESAEAPVNAPEKLEIGAPLAPPGGHPADRGLFYRPGDRALCDRLCVEILDNGMNLTIVAENVASADHYFRLLVQRMRAKVAFRLEMHAPADTADLLECFNGTLAPMSAADAFAQAGPANPMRLLVFRNSDWISPAEGRTLARLLNSFPGAGIQVMLLQTGLRGAFAEDALHSPAKRMLCWTVRSPSPDEVLAMIAASRVDDAELGEVIDLLDEICPAALAEAGQILRREQQAAAGIVSPPAAVIEPVEEAPALTPATPLAPRWVASVAALMVAVVAAGAILSAVFPRQTAALVAAVGTVSSGVQGRPAPPPVPPPVEPLVIGPVPNAPAMEAPVAATRDANGPAAATGSAIQEAATGAGKLEPVALAVVEVAREPAPKAAEPTPKTAEPTPKTAEPTPKTAEPVPVPNTARAELNKTIAKVRATPSGEFFLQHIAFDDYDRALAWRENNPRLSKAWVVPVQAVDGGAVKYVVVSGPFKTRAAATSYSQRNYVPEDGWIRPALALARVATLGKQASGETNGR